MTARLPLLDECEYYTTANDAGDRFVGRVKQFSDLKTRPFASRADAANEIVTITAARLRRLHGALPLTEEPSA